jgi:hypothetical protein
VQDFGLGSRAFDCRQGEESPDQFWDPLGAVSPGATLATRLKPVSSSKIAELYLHSIFELQMGVCQILGMVRVPESQ